MEINWGMSKNLKLLLFFNSIFMVGASLLAPIYALFVEQFEASLFLISASYATYIFSSVIFGLLAMKFATHRFCAKSIMVSSLFLRTFVYIAYIFMADYSHLMLIQVLLGLSEALGTPSHNTLFFQNLLPNNETNNYFVADVIGKLTIGIGALAGGIIASYSFNIIFVVVSVFSLVSALGILATVKEGHA